MDIKLSTKLTTNTFTKAFIAQLVLSDFKSLCIDDWSSLQGFRSAVEFLDCCVERLNCSSTSDQYPLFCFLVHIANELRPSSTGAFDGFKHALVCQQLTFCNLSVDDRNHRTLGFDISKSYAREEIVRLTKPVQLIIEQFTQAFVRFKIDPHHDTFLNVESFC